MKILTLDIESAPSKVYRWSLFGNDTTSVNQIEDAGHLLCFAWKWRGDDLLRFGRAERYRTAEESDSLKRLWYALDDADIVVTYNGKKYDIPKLNSAFLEAGLGPPSPYHQVDLYTVIRKNFGEVKNSLEYVSQKYLGVGKTPHEGFDLWVKCMAGDEDAWARMREYNMNDVVITEQLYDKLLPWIPNHPNVLLFEDDRVGIACPRCASTSYHKEGFKVASTRVYQQYQCNTCRAWFRDTRSFDGTSVTG